MVTHDPIITNSLANATHTSALPSLYGCVVTLGSHWALCPVQIFGKKTGEGKMAPFYLSVEIWNSFAAELELVYLSRQHLLCCIYLQNPTVPRLPSCRRDFYSCPLFSILSRCHSSVLTSCRTDLLGWGRRIGLQGKTVLFRLDKDA